MKYENAAGSATGQMPKRVAELTQSINDLQEGICQLDTIVTRLDEALAEVMSPAPAYPEAERTSLSSKEALAELKDANYTTIKANQIQALTNNIYRLTSYLYSMAERIEI